MLCQVGSRGVDLLGEGGGTLRWAIHLVPGLPVQRSYATLRLRLGDYDEGPGLLIASAWCPHRRLQCLADQLHWHRDRLEAPNGPLGLNGLEQVESGHGLPHSATLRGGWRRLSFAMIPSISATASSSALSRFTTT